MNINFTMFGIETSGGAKIILGHASRLAQKGHRVSITTLGQKAHHKDLPKTKKVKINYVGNIDINAEGPELAIRNLAEKTPECDINIATFSLTAFAVHRSNKGQGFYYMQHFEPLFFEHDPYMQKLVTESYFLPLKQIANSSWLKNTLKQELKIVTAKIPVINSSVDLSLYRPTVKKPHNKIRVICMARPMKWKGFKEADQAMKETISKRPNVDFLVFRQPGSSLTSNVATKVFDRLSQRQLVNLLSSAHIVISPSWYESSPLLVLEAMACGATVITTSVGTEDIIKNDKNGLVVPTKNPKKLAKAIISLVDNSSKRERLRSNAFKTIKHFNEQQATAKVEKLFKNSGLNSV